ncbi:hypothetical protein D9756_011463 [Leucocoprinus leucothites]|uniref:Uncharacterized protein n=1 Tax=Leucocoprinus leucothites TaxID=201217 RepID=A0A8H5FPS8_9AGAR|nr:hypothetical protein D9756_011463 [Leucoagaricus leucothites]
MRHKNGSTVDVVFILYRPTNDSSATKSIPGITPAPLIYQIRSRQSFKPLASSSASLVHSLNSDVFEELDTNRDSSWQYEIQQIRFANQRLEDEIAALTKQLEEAEDVQQKVYEDLQRPSTRENVLDQYVSSTTSSSPLLHQSLHLWALGIMVASNHIRHSTTTKHRRRRPLPRAHPPRFTLNIIPIPCLELILPSL